MDQTETEKVKNPFKKYLIIILIAGIIAFFFFKSTFLKSSARETPKKEVKRVQKEEIRPLIHKPKFKEHKKPIIREEKKLIKLSYATIGKTKLIVDPINNNLIPSHQFKYPIRWVVSNGRLQAWTELPKKLLKTPKKDQETEKKILP